MNSEAEKRRVSAEDDGVLDKIEHATFNYCETLKALKALYILFFLIKLKTLEAI